MAVINRSRSKSVLPITAPTSSQSALATKCGIALVSLCLIAAVAAASTLAITRNGLGSQLEVVATTTEPKSAGTASTISFAEPIVNGQTTREEQAPSVKAPPTCQDKASRCQEWAAANECVRNPNFMRKQCAKSCDACEAAGQGEQQQRAQPAQGPAKQPAPAKQSASCDSWAAKGECEKNPRYMMEKCRVACEKRSAVANKEEA